MAARSYDAALARLLVHEGGYTNHPADPGGPTNFGITISDYRKYVKPDATAADVRAMKVDEAKAIYRAKYWDAQRCDELPAGVDYAVFDYGVNSGIGRSGKVLRRVLGLSDDGLAHVSDAVIAAARAARCEGADRRDLRRAAALFAVAQDLGRVRQGLGRARRRGESLRAAARRRRRGAPCQQRQTEQAGKGVVPAPKACAARLGRSDRRHRRRRRAPSASVGRGSGTRRGSSWPPRRRRSPLARSGIGGSSGNRTSRPDRHQHRRLSWNSH